MRGTCLRVQVLAVLVLDLSAGALGGGSPYGVATERQPFFLCDERVVEDRWLVERFVEPLQKDPRNPLIVKEYEWEGSGPHMGGSVLYDPSDRLYKIWYCVFDRYRYDNKLPFSYNVCYAESDDGIAWRKPALGVFQDEAAAPNNNCIRLGTDKTQNIDVALNPRPDLAPGKFLAIHNQKGGVFVSYSDDGKSFTFLQDDPAIQYHSDTHNNLVHDEVRDRWLIFCRPRAYAGDHKRRVSMQESRDLRAWTHERTILIPTENEKPEFYGMTVFRRGDLFFGMLQVYDRSTGFMEPELRWSADGVQWDGVASHPSVLERGAPGAWDRGMVMPAESPVVLADEMRFYYGGFEKSHDAKDNPCAIGMAVAERDRLVGLRPSSDAPGFVLTRPLTLPKMARIALNARVAEGGHISVELRDDNNKPLHGFTHAACDPVTHSGFAQPVTWGGRLPDAGAEFVRIHFELHRAEFFTFGFEAP